MAGPNIEPMPKKPSAQFMIDVCSAVDLEMSPISASAPVLKIPMAMPESAINTQKNTNEFPARNRNEVAAKSVKPIRMVDFLPYRSAR